MCARDVSKGQSVAQIFKAGRASEYVIRDTVHLRVLGIFRYWPPEHLGVLLSMAHVPQLILGEAAGSGGDLTWSAVKCQMSLRSADERQPMVLEGLAASTT